MNNNSPISPQPIVARVGPERDGSPTNNLTNPRRHGLDSKNGGRSRMFQPFQPFQPISVRCALSTHTCSHARGRALDRPKGWNGWNGGAV